VADGTSWNRPRAAQKFFNSIKCLEDKLDSAPGHHHIFPLLMRADFQDLPRSALESLPLLVKAHLMF
jgi:hypothetical protein